MNASVIEAMTVESLGADFFVDLTLDRQLRLHPGIEAAGKIYHIVVPGALQRTDCDQAAVAAFAVHRDRHIFVDLRQRLP